MQVYVTNLEHDWTEELEHKLKNDDRIKHYEDLYFCTGQDVEILKNEYGVIFINAESTLSDILSSYITSDFLDLEIGDILKTRNDEKLFHSNFTLWLEELKNILENNV